MFKEGPADCRIGDWKHLWMQNESVVAWMANKQPTLQQHFVHENLVPETATESLPTVTDSP